jgi:hypothetical protein
MSASEWNAKMQRDEMRRVFSAKFVMANGRYPTNDEYTV